MSLGFDAWDGYRLFCLSATASPLLEYDLPPLVEEEIADRLGLAEDYAAGRVSLLRASHDAYVRLCCRARQEVLADEAEERRFISTDSAYLPYLLFAQVLHEATRVRLIALEEGARRDVAVEYMESFRAVLFPLHEGLLRMYVTSEALDSLAVKACVVGRTGLREGRLARTSAPGSSYTPSSAASALVSLPLSSSSPSGGALTGPWRSAAAAVLVSQEEEERQLLHRTRAQFMSTATKVQARCAERGARGEASRRASGGATSVPVQ